MLKLNNVDVCYGKVQALYGVNLEIKEGSIVSLLGANGAGKSTVLKVISRLVQQKTGSITFREASLDKSSPTKVVKQGIIHCPENRKIFPLLTVEENLKGWGLCTEG